MWKGPRTQAVLAVLLGAYLRAALWTTRWRLEGAEHLAPALAGAPQVVAFWHEVLPLMPALLHLARRTGRPAPARVLVSRHRDGRLIGRLMAGFGMGVVHGSRKSGGAAGLRACAEALAAGETIVLTPDGPRGPRRVAAPGVAHLAALAGVAVLPAGASSTRVWRINSWDRMAIPLPFGRGVLVCGAPVPVPREGWEASLPMIAHAMTAAADRAHAACHGS